MAKDTPLTAHPRARRASDVPGRRKQVLDCVLLPARKKPRHPAPVSQASGSSPSQGPANSVKPFPKSTLSKSVASASDPATNPTPRGPRRASTNRLAVLAAESETATCPSKSSTSELKTSTRKRKRAVSDSHRDVRTTLELGQESIKPRTTRRSLNFNAVSALPALSATSAGESADDAPARATRSKDKGKSKAINPSSPPADVTSRSVRVSRPKSRSGSKEVKKADAGPSARSSKRQRVDREHATVEETVDEEANAVIQELDFHMLDMPAVAALPWVRTELGSDDHLYVPPGVQSLIENMKNMLSAESDARRQAEKRYMEELNRRVALEKDLEDQRMLNDLKATLSNMPLAEVEKAMNASGVSLDGMRTLPPPEGAPYAQYADEQARAGPSTAPQEEAAPATMTADSGVTSEATALALTQPSVATAEPLPRVNAQDEVPSSSLASASRPRTLARWSAQDSINRLLPPL